MTTFVKLANGNYQGDVQLLAEAYEALSATTKREGGSYVDHINAAVVAYDMMLRVAAKETKP